MSSRKNLKILFIIALLLSGLFSCDNSLFNETIKRDEPFQDVVNVESINDGLALSIRWKSDNGADGYRLMRSVEVQNGYSEFTQIYYGTKTGYTDLTIEQDKSYMFRLDKERGNKIFEGKDVTVYLAARDIPVPGVITVESMNEGKTAYLAWDADDWTELYVVNKTEVTSLGIDFNDETITKAYEIYSKTNYVDNDIDTGRSYAYRLDKWREDKVVEGTEIVIFEKSRSLPFPGAITAKRLSDGTAAYLTWYDDPGADSYRVMRAMNDGSEVKFTPREEGNDGYYSQGPTAALDNAIEDDNSYLYRLDKERDGTWYLGKEVTVVSAAKAIPAPGVVTVRSMNEGQTAYLVWDPDEWTERFIIKKTEVTSSGIDFANVTITETFEFSGRTNYVDNDIDTGRSYAYRLDKWRGERVVEGTEIVIFEKSRSLPFPGVITAKSLNGGKAAYLTWQADPGADAYRVMRALNDGPDVIFTLREEGNDGYNLQGDTAAIDSALEDDKSYLYRLDKERDGTWYFGSDVTVFSRTRPMPFGEAPVANGFRSDGKISLQWTFDEGADTYVLMRRYDDPLINDFDEWEPVYEGSDENYLDESVNHVQSGRYEYRLDKRRNGDIYPWTNLTTLAVACSTDEDAHEPNNKKEQATIIETYRIANIYCFGYSDNRIIEDGDWFKVSIPAGKTANISVTYGNQIDDNYLMLYRLGQTPTTITHNVAFKVKNDGLTQQFVPFSIVPDQSRFLTNGSGGTVISYTITWVSITDD
ncbi:MAG TPA: hypothetical protein VJZ01_05130 [Lachnospiraceae bacterium]|nr:hypothetical protein [Lachnospiraceae bacterium]